jgi:hypothetical protein
MRKSHTDPEFPFFTSYLVELFCLAGSVGVFKTKCLLAKLWLSFSLSPGSLNFGHSQPEPADSLLRTGQSQGESCLSHCPDPLTHFLRPLLSSLSTLYKRSTLCLTFETLVCTTVHTLPCASFLTPSQTPQSSFKKSLLWSPELQRIIARNFIGNC